MLSSNRSTWKLPSGGCLKRPVDDGTDPSKSFGFGTDWDAGVSEFDDLNQWDINNFVWTDIPTNVAFIRVYVAAEQQDNACFNWSGCEEGNREWTCPVGSPCCASIVGACCITGSDECTLATKPQCDLLEGAFLGEGTTCEPDICDGYVMGKCCYDGACPECRLCSTTTQLDCANREGGSFTEGAECSGVFSVDCVDCGSTPFGEDACGYCLSRACCTESGCSTKLPCDCVNEGGEVQTVYSCTPNNPCPQGCCFLDGTCENLPAAQCTSQGGFPLGDGNLCGDVDCPDIVYCCNGSQICGNGCSCQGQFDPFNNASCEDGSTPYSTLSDCQLNCGVETWCCDVNSNPRCFSVGINGVCPLGASTLSCEDECNDCCNPFTSNEEEGTADREFNPDGSLKPIYAPLGGRLAVKNDLMTLEQYKWIFGPDSSTVVLPTFDDQLTETYNAKIRSLTGFNISAYRYASEETDYGLSSEEYNQQFQGVPECVICEQEGGISGASFDCGAPDPAIIAIEYDIRDVCDYDQIRIGVYRSTNLNGEDIVRIALVANHYETNEEIFITNDTFTSGWISQNSDPAGNISFNCETCEWELNCGSSYTLNNGTYQFIPELTNYSDTSYNNSRTISYVTTSNPNEEPRNVSVKILGVGEHINIVDEFGTEVITLIGGASDSPEPDEGSDAWNKVTNQLRYDDSRIQSEAIGDVYILGSALAAPYATKQGCGDIVLDKDALTGVVFAGPDSGCNGACKG